MSKLALVLLGLIAACQDAAPKRAAPAVAEPQVAAAPVTMTATAARGRLELAFTNTSAAKVAIARHVIGARLPNYDWLTVELDGPGGKRTLGFVQARDESGVITVEVAPGATHVETIDLVQWSVEGPAGAPLAPGTYQLRAAWDTSKETRAVGVVASATAMLVVEPPGTAACTNDGIPDPSKTRMVLLARQAPVGRATVDVGLYNAGDTRVCVKTHVKTHEIQNDWLTIQYADGGKYHHASRVITLNDARDKSYPVSVLLEPGQVAWQQVDVDAWAKRERNGKEPVPAGSLYAHAAYDATRETDVWAGKLLSAPFGMDVK
jgi:hypothetical protein